MTNSNPISYRQLEPEQLDLIRPLWEALRDFHTTVPNRFAPTVVGRPFEPRRLELCRKAVEGRLRIEIASVTADDSTIAYCVTSLSAAGAGELESLYVAPEFRRRGIAGRLVRSALDWLIECEAKTRRVVVFHGNDEALAFYTRIGFHPRNLELEI
jgi:diamine N-acetyltransferase